MQRRPYVSVAAVIEREGRFLMVEERTDTGRTVLNQPAGHLEPRETLVQAVQREVLEETAWHFAPAGLVGLYLYHNPDADRSYLRVCFFGPVLAHEAERALDAEVLQCLWLDRAALAAMQGRLRTPLVNRCIDDYLAGRRFPLAVVADGAGLV
ncbi:MAG: NUDIX hydrolase [Gammaproteobacteria bacterium]